MPNNIENKSQEHFDRKDCGNQLCCWGSSKKRKPMTQQNKSTELIERIVILYANLSGRETANRAEFREEVEKLLVHFLSQRDDELIGELEHYLTHDDDCVRILYLSKECSCGLSDTFNLIKERSKR